MPDSEAQVQAERWLKDSLALQHGVGEGASMTWPQLLQGIRSTIFVSGDTEEPSSRAKLLLLVQIDEFQVDRDICTHLVRQLSRLLTSTTHFHDHQVYIVPIFTGTWIGSLALATEYKTHQYMLSGLDSLQDARTFFSQHLQLLDPSAKSHLTQYEEDVIIGHIGYIPRMIDVFCKVIKDHAPSDFETAWAPLRQLIYQYYPTEDLSPLEQQHLCLLSYFRIPLAMGYRINGHTVLEMMVNGTLFLSKVGADIYVVVLPTIFFVKWLPQTFNRDLFVNPKNQVDEHTLPNLAMCIHRATYSMLRTWSEVQMKLKISHSPNSPEIKIALSTANHSSPSSVQGNRNRIACKGQP
jgi:hypothetical protein